VPAETESLGDFRYPANRTVIDRTVLKQVAEHAARVKQVASQFPRFFAVPKLHLMPYNGRGIPRDDLLTAVAMTGWKPIPRLFQGKNG